MNKYDWIEVAARVIGLWFVVSALQALVNAIAFASGGVGQSLLSQAFFPILSSSFLGTALLVLAPPIRSFLERMDARSGQEPTAREVEGR